MNDFIEDPTGGRRPDHPDFWKLAEVVLGLDGRLEDEGDAEDLLKNLVEEIISMDVVVYVAEQRVTRPFQHMGLNTVPMGLFASMMATWMDGFMAGARFVQRHPKEKS